MLQCAECGEPVSAWAARCPMCRHGTENAVEIPDEPIRREVGADQDEPAVVPDPAEDLVPDRVGPAKRPWYRRPLTLGAGVVVLIAATSAAAIGVDSSGGGTVPASVRALEGTIVAQGLDGTPLMTNPDGAHQHRVTTLHLPAGPIPGVTAALDGRLLVSSTGGPAGGPAVIRVEGGELAPHPIPAVGAFRSLSVAQAVSFADADQAIVVVTGGLLSSHSTVSVVSLDNGTGVGLGPADTAAGDPRSLGAFVSVPVSGPASSGRRVGATSDRSIELRVANLPPATLATSGELNEDVGLLPSTPVDLAVFPDLTGDKLAVVLNPLSATNSDVPMVVLDRDGHVLTAVSEADGPTANAQPVWSPDGQLLAYPTYTSTGPALAVQTSSGQTETYHPSDPNTQIGRCIWSPTLTTVLCLIQTASHAAWDFADLGNGSLDTVSSVGYPIVWLPGNHQ